MLSRRAWLAAGWLQTFVLVVLCLLPLERMPGPDLPWTDKLYHTAAFTLLMWWFAVALPRGRWPRTGLLLALLGVGIEIAQGFVPLRAPSFADTVADTLGVLLGALLARLTPPGLPAWRRTT